MKRNEFLNDFRVRLREVRRALGMTQDKFCKELGISKPTYVRYESGEMMPKLQLLSFLISKFDINSNWILTGKGEMFLGGELADIASVNPKTMRDERYLLLIKLMNVPVVEQIMMAKLEETRALFRPQIEAYFSPAAQERSA